MVKVGWFSRWGFYIINDTFLRSFRERFIIHLDHVYTRSTQKRRQHLYTACDRFRHCVNLAIRYFVFRLYPSFLAFWRACEALGTETATSRQFGRGEVYCCRFLNLS